jgi:phospholipid transport system substrate-binding protein
VIFAQAKTLRFGAAVTGALFLLPLGLSRAEVRVSADAPAEVAPAEIAPVENAPAENAPVENAPVEYAPVENAPIGEALAPVSAGPESPESQIRRLNTTLIGIMKSAEEGLSYQGRFERVAPVVQETFDMPFMAAKTIGSYWRKLDPEERRRWVKAFGDFTISNFADRFDGFSGQTLEIRGERPASRDTLIVETRLNRPGDDAVDLDYRMRARAGDWRVVDIYSDGSVSEVALRRSEYASFLKGGGIDDLIAAVSAKTAKRARQSLE